MIQFPPFAPDAVAHNIQVAAIADGVVAAPNGYRSLPTPVANGVLTSGGNITSTRTLRIKLSNGLWYTVSMQIDSSNNPEFYVAASAFHQASLVYISDFWKLTPVIWNEEDLLIFGSLTVPQKIAITGLDDFGVTKTSDIGGSPPAAEFAAVVRNQLVLGRTYESSTLYDTRVWWSAFGDYEGWTSGTNQAGFEDLKSGGKITGVIGGEYGLIFQERAITRINYIGAPEVWEFDPIETRRGAIAPDSILQAGSDVYFLSEGGFYVLRDGSIAEPIGAGLVDEWVLKNGFAGTFDRWAQRINGQYDQVSGCCFWGFHGGSDTGGHPDRMIIYDTKNKGWSTATIDNRDLFQVEPKKALVGGGGTVDGWSHYGLGIAQYDATDTRVEWFEIHGGEAGDGFDSETATLESAWIFDEVNRTLVDSIRAHIDGDHTLELITKDELEDADVENGAVAADVYGKCDFDIEARYIKVKLVSTGNWTEVSGFTPKQSPAGEF